MTNLIVAVVGDDDWSVISRLFRDRTLDSNGLFTLSRVYHCGCGGKSDSAGDHHRFPNWDWL